MIIGACLAAGMICIPLNPGYKPAEMDAYLRKLRPSICFCEARYFASVAKIPSSVVEMERRLIVGDDIEGTGLRSWQALQRETGDPLPPVDQQAPAVMIHTSGTTGSPKFVVHTQASLAHILERIAGAGFDDSTRLLVTLPSCYMSGLVALISCMSSGMSAVLLESYEPDASLDAIEKHRCTSIFMTPYMISSLNQAQRMHPRRVDSLKLCVVGGDVCRPAIKQEFAELFGQPLRSGWGMTEAIGTLSGGEVDGAYVARPGCAQLVGEDGNVVKDGDEGELVIRGNNVFMGYWLGPNLVDDGRIDGWFHTGDIMRKDDNGELRYVARKKDLIVINGHSVAPVEVENALLLHHAVVEAAVVGLPDLERGQRIVGFVVLNASSGSSPEDILRDVATKVAGYKVPEKLFIVDRIPRNGMGKAIRPRLMEQATEV
ncbi:Long-chain-fatty-acid--CoA ligase [Paraburkholderia solisilvae]|uniref:Long-chain-fatty-acid--CoA ligase n=1 Tax=Paraburkholderia solisilvae TaxID=624376 RepID=A0A6J5EP22_9BURK|nr:Long-chain-fatty-acid--CoA ligase [Paraburkholderia solisilvae]